MEYGAEIRDVQMVILGIFKEILRICEDNHISYFIACGTALGAVQHGGFIPWDDDLDIGMTRENYNKFLKIAPSVLPNDLFLQTVDTDPESIFYFTKVRKSGTKFVEKYCRNLKMHHGIYVDIFPFDNISDDETLRKKHYKKVNFWSNIFISKCITGTSVPQHGIVGKLKIATRLVTHFILKPVPKHYLYTKLDLVRQQYNSTQCKKISYVGAEGEQLPLSDANDPQKILFEGIEVKCPKNIEKYLEKRYPNYLTLPPIEERVGHRPYCIET